MAPLRGEKRLILSTLKIQPDVLILESCLDREARATKRYHLEQFPTMKVIMVDLNLNHIVVYRTQIVQINKPTDFLGTILNSAPRENPGNLPVNPVEDRKSI